MNKPLKIGLTGIAAAAAVAFGVHVYGHFAAPEAHAGEGHAHGGHEHGGEAGGGGLAALALHDGKKWETDASLRDGMAKIRQLMADAVPRIHAGGFADADYVALAGQLGDAVNGIIQTCKLPPEADAQIHHVLVEVLDGARVMRDGGDRHSGAVKVVRALQAYPTYFDDPGFQPLE